MLHAKSQRLPTSLRHLFSGCLLQFSAKSVFMTDCKYLFDFSLCFKTFPDSLFRIIAHIVLFPFVSAVNILPVTRYCSSEMFTTESFKCLVAGALLPSGAYD